MAVYHFDDFTRGDNPYGERDFGVFRFEGTKFYWKIDYYDRTLSSGSPDPADSEVTTRVLTILLPEEW